MTEDRVSWHLWNWTRIHHMSREAGEGYPSRAVVGDNYTSGFDFDREWDTVCKRLAEATEAAIEDLPPIYRDSVYAHDLGGPWLLPVIALGIHYRAAIPLIGRGLDKRGIL